MAIFSTHYLATKLLDEGLIYSIPLLGNSWEMRSSHQIRGFQESVP